MTRRSNFLLLAIFQLWFIAYTHAEKADFGKPLEITGDGPVTSDEIHQTSTLTGNVILTQGTLVMRGGKIVYITTPDGYRFATLYAPAGGVATMRQKRDGGSDLWVEGEAADRITYDQKNSIATLYLKAKVRRLTGTKETDESDAPFLSYNSQSEIVSGFNSVTGVSQPGGGRVRIVIQPRAQSASKDDAH